MTKGREGAITTVHTSVSVSETTDNQHDTDPRDNTDPLIPDHSVHIIFISEMAGQWRESTATSDTRAAEITC